MAQHKLAFDEAMKNEGGYANVKGDDGGMTYKGIAYKFWPNWVGWPKIKAWIAQHGEPKRGHIFTDIEGLDTDVYNFYEINFWGQMNGYNINSQEVATFLYDWFIHSGRTVIKKLQKLVEIEPPSGYFGTVTLERVNNVGAPLLDSLYLARNKFYVAHCEVEKEDKKFLEAWLRRSDTLYKKLKAIV